MLIGEISPPEGRPKFVGPRILRLVQGASYQVSTAEPGNPKVVALLGTGKACNMVSQKLKLDMVTLYAVPITASCTPGTNFESSELLRRNIAP